MSKSFPTERPEPLQNPDSSGATGTGLSTRLFVTRRDGSELEIQASGSRSVMELIRDEGVDELVAMCGGCCSCATCHVYVDPEFADKLAPMSGPESDLLDCSASRQATSRLSCQIPFTQALDGLRVTVAPED